jgi:hypothetical protein
MEYANAFAGKAKQPSNAEVAAALGSCANLWAEFIQWMADDEGVGEQEWKGICVSKYGWSLRLKQKKRNIVYLGPGAGCFMVSFVLNDKALAAAKASRLSRVAAEAVGAALRYPEGNGVRLIVRSAADLPAIRTIVALKLSN